MVLRWGCTDIESRAFDEAFYAVMFDDDFHGFIGLKFGRRSLTSRYSE